MCGRFAGLALSARLQKVDAESRCAPLVVGACSNPNPATKLLIGRYVVKFRAIGDDLVEDGGRRRILTKTIFSQERRTTVLARSL